MRLDRARSAVGVAAEVALVVAGEDPMAAGVVVAGGIKHSKEVPCTATRLRGIPFLHARGSGRSGAAQTHYGYKKRTLPSKDTKNVEGARLQLSGMRCLL
jgi:hypothetical protein